MINKSMRALKYLLSRVIGFAAQHFARVLAPIITHMARTGVGTDLCLRLGSLPMPVNFHSPVPDLEDLERRKVWDSRSDLVGIDFRPDAQMAFLLKLGKQFGHECDWPSTPSGDPYTFYTENPSFSYGCAALTHCMLRHFKPRRVIEIGSGNSSLVIAKTLSLNAQDSTGKAEYIIVDPYPRLMIGNGLPALTELVKERVELLDVNFFDQLGKDDVLFIDSGHVVRTGSDVNYLILDILPRLASGVIVHLHDIGLPYDYPKVYATNPKFRVFWTESYLLQAFLCCNNQYEILLAMNYLMTEHQEVFSTAFPLYDALKHRGISGSFWIHRK
jgi:hypothetical protein